MNHFKLNNFSRKHLLKVCSSAFLGVQFKDQLIAENNSKNNKKIVRIFTYGGMSQLDSFDPKPKHSEVMGNTKVIPTSNDDYISHFFPKMAKHLDKLTLLRGMKTSEADHGRAKYLMERSYSPLGTTKHPTFGAWMHKMKGTLNSSLPSSVHIGGSNGAGFLESKYDGFKVSNPNNPLDGLISDKTNTAEYQNFLKYVAQVNRKFHAEYKEYHNLDSYRDMHNSAMQFIHSSELDAFDLSKATRAESKKYNIPFGPSFLLAKRLLHSNVQYVTLTPGAWDHHYYIWDETTNGGFVNASKALDDAFSVFLEDLISEGLWDNTILCLNNEFGRTPRIGKELGRSHHNKAFSSIIGGAGIKKGFIYGKTDETASKVIENTVTPQDFNATLAHLVGIDLDKEIYSPDNRPFTITRGGQVVKDILT